MSGLDKAAHVKLQQYINGLVLEVDRPYSIIFDEVDAREYYQHRSILIKNGLNYLILSTDVDYTTYIHGSEDCEGELIISQIPYQAVRRLCNDHILSLEDDREQLKHLRLATSPPDPINWTFSEDRYGN